jgi:hypothetical protein
LAAGRIVPTANQRISWSLVRAPVVEIIQTRRRVFFGPIAALSGGRSQITPPREKLPGGYHLRQQKSTAPSLVAWSKKYHAQLSFPEYWLPGIHFTLPTLTIFLQRLRYGAACMVCIQSPSNSNHVGRILDKCRISGWRMLLLQGGFVISVSFKLFKNFNENL